MNYSIKMLKQNPNSFYSSIVRKNLIKIRRKKKKKKNEKRMDT